MFKQACLCGTNIMDTFLKYLDNFEKDRESKGVLSSQKYRQICFGMRHIR